MSGKMGTRSWHPSPFGSDDETEEHHFFKEEKKNRIKMEISRRRHTIEENARLHEELILLANLRESAELGADSHRLGIAGYPSPSISPGREGNSVLRSVDEILRNEHGASQYGVGGSSVHRNPGRREQGRYHDEDHIGGSFNTDRYTATVYDRVTDFSPVNSDFSNEFPHNPMPLLPDIASRSRKLIDDLNTSSGYHLSSKYATRSNFSIGNTCEKIKKSFIKVEPCLPTKSWSKFEYILLLKFKKLLTAVYSSMFTKSLLFYYRKK